MKEEKKRNKNPFVYNGEPATLQKDFDTDYKSIEIVDEVVPVGEPDANGKQSYVLKKVVHETFTPIQDVIDADKENVGIENIIKQVMRTGDLSLLPVDKGDCNVDLVGAPESLMEVKQMGVDAQKSFEKLPEDLVNGMDMTSFVNSMTQEKFDEFIKAVQSRSAGKVENNGE